MRKSASDSLQGALGLLVLQTLGSRGRLHGYGITAHIHTVSRGDVRVEEGSLYPALHRMEQDGWVKAEWGLTEKNRRARFYTLTAAGRQRLQAEHESWNRFSGGVRRVLRYT